MVNYAAYDWDTNPARRTAVDVSAGSCSKDSSPTHLTPAYIAGLEATLRGFHTIEYLLVGVDGTMPAGAFTPRELTYLVSAATVLRDDARTLVSAWMPSGGDYAGDLARAGEAGSRYVSAEAGVRELVGGLITIADEVGSGKIGGPHAAARGPRSRASAATRSPTSPTTSGASRTCTSATTPGVSDLVARRDADLGARVQSEIAAAIRAIEAIPGPFSTAIDAERPAVQAFIDAVLALRATLEGPGTAALR